MAQTTTAQLPAPPNIVTGIETGAAINNLRESALSNHSGTTRPSYAVANMTWVDTDANTLYFYDGTTDHEIGSIVGGKFVAKNADNATTADSATTATTATSATNSTNAANILQTTDPASGTYRLLLGNGEDSNAPAYNLTALYYHTSTGTIVGANIDGNAATASAVAWGDVTSKPSTFPPSTHTHTGVYAPVSTAMNSASGVNDIPSFNPITEYAKNNNDGYVWVTYVVGAIDSGDTFTLYLYNAAKASFIIGVYTYNGATTTEGSVTCLVPPDFGVGYTTSGSFTITTAKSVGGTLTTTAI